MLGSQVKKKVAQARQADTWDETNIQMVAQYLTLLSNAFTQLNKAEVSVPLADRLGVHPHDKDGLPTIVGYPGGTKMSIDALSGALTAIVTSFVEESEQIIETMRTSIAELETERSKTILPLIKAANDAMMSLDGLSSVLDEICADKSHLTQQFAGYTNTLAHNEGPNKSMLSQYEKQFQVVLKARAENEVKRGSVIEASQLHIQRLRDVFAKLRAAMDSRNKKLMELFVNIGITYSDAAAKVAMAGAQVKEAMEQLDARDDLMKFVRQRKIARYDLRDIEFEAIDTSGPAFEGVDTKIAVEVADVYPIGMARVVKDYLASDEKQMNCKAGKYLMLMEEPDEDWCYVMNPITLACGFVPTECLDRVQGSLGIVIRQPSGIDDTRLTVGDFVMIVETTSSAYITEDVMGERGIYPKHIIGVIYS